METQKSVADWAFKTFGKRDLNYRIRNFLEEAIELAEACGLRGPDIRNVVEGVLNRGQLSGFI